MLTDVRELIRATVIRVLTEKLGPAKRGAGEIDERCDLLDIGIDSEDLVEIILEVEEQCQCQFNPDAVELDGRLTLRSLINAFGRTTSPA